MFTLTLIMNAITKIAYKQGRPFWIDETLFQKGACSYEFGNPSGHSMTAAALAVTITLDISKN
jgi:membrane-associated phospholipid phosphatase